MDTNTNNNAVTVVLKILHLNSKFITGISKFISKSKAAKNFMFVWEYIRLPTYHYNWYKNIVYPLFGFPLSL